MAWGGGKVGRWGTWRKAEALKTTAAGGKHRDENLEGITQCANYRGGLVRRETET